MTTTTIRRTRPAKAPTAPVAYKVSDIARQGIVGLSKLYEMINAGEIPARKFGGTTLILASDWENYIANLPVVQPKKAKGEA